jgi:glycosyltransferase involved in cell wall biosynthesis
MLQRELPRVLVISHNVFSTTGNMGKTLSAFFAGWDSDKLAQIYFHSEVPNSAICKNYYRITDFDLLKSIFKRQVVGDILTKSDIFENCANTRIDRGIKSNIYQYGRKRKPYMYCGRNLLWRFGKWHTPQLEEWIDQFDPQVIFFAAGDYMFSFKIALFFAESRNIPLVVYFCDDYFLIKRNSISPLYWINRYSFNRKFAETVGKSVAYFTISDQMNEAYFSAFNKKGHVMMTASNMLNIPNDKVSSSIKISYIGNLGFNRWNPLVQIGRVLKNIVYEEQSLHINVYSSEKREEVLKHLTAENGIQFRGFLNSSQVIEKMHESTLLLHVEELDNEINKEKVKYSISTKIADSLASGTCLFAYGPAGVASIDYLKQNNAACVVTDKNKLEETLRELINNADLRQSYIKKALQLANERHNPEKNIRRFEEIICNAVNSYGIEKVK